MRDALMRDDIAAALRRISLTRGDIVVLHSSLASLGWVDGGAQAVVDAFIDVLGHEGLLMVPTFNYEVDGVFERSAPVLTGAIPQAVNARADAVRSCCPTHSVAAIGSRARELCADHHARPALGLDSPMDRAAQAGGSVMLLGVLHNRNSTVHVAEAHAGLPYLGVPFTGGRRDIFQTRLWDGSIATVRYSEFPGCSSAFGAIEGPMRRQNRIRDFRINQARVQLMRGRDVIQTVIEMVDERPDWLLCTDPDCWTCPQRREMLRGWRP